MENFDQIFTLLAEHEGISLNTNILETGLINILALIVILFFSVRNLLGPILGERKTTIVKGVQDAENRLNEAQKRLEEAQKQLNQANLVIDGIKNETLKTKTILLESDVLQARQDLTIRFERALASFRSKERQVFLEIKRKIIFLVLQQTLNRTQKLFESSFERSLVTTEAIKKLKGDLL